MEKIKMQNPIVEMDGDEMTRILWAMIKDQLLNPFIELNTEYYDLGLVNRDATDDKVTWDAGYAIKKYHVGVKCATITPNAQRMTEYNLKKMYKSPNGTIRGILDGTVFRTPIVTPGVKTYIPGWTAPITVARHSYGDIYKDTEFRIDEPGKAELVFTGVDGRVQRETIYEFECPGVLQGAYNKDTSIESFARSCFEYALSEKKDLWFSTKDTIMKKYDGDFKETFQHLYDTEYKERFEEAGIEYFYTLIDDAVARVIRSHGGMIWALKNYDGDVMSDMISTAFGSLAMMTSVLCSPDGKFEYEAAHGTVTRHYYKYKETGEMTSTNPMATIFAWSGALRKRGEMDGLADLQNFADQLEGACFDTLYSGIMTKDLVGLAEGIDAKAVTTDKFIAEIRKNLEKRLA